MKHVLITGANKGIMYFIAPGQVFNIEVPTEKQPNKSG